VLLGYSYKPYKHDNSKIGRGQLFQTVVRELATIGAERQMPFNKRFYYISSVFENTIDRFRVSSDRAKMNNSVNVPN
jgi:hypothetical protein